MCDVCPKAAVIEQMKADEADAAFAAKHYLAHMARAPQELPVGLIELLAQGLDAINQSDDFESGADRRRVPPGCATRCR